MANKNHTVLKELIKSYPLALRKKAAKLQVRELERERPDGDKYISFVDDGPDSYDVQLEMAKDESVSHVSCDCDAQADDVCVHRVAMVLALKEWLKNQKSSKPPKRKSSDPLSELLQNIPKDDLDEWLLTIMKKEKFVKELFLIQFSTVVDISPPSEKEIRTKIEDIIKSVTGRRKNINSTEANRVRRLLDQYAAPYLTTYLQQPTHSASVPLVSAILAAYYVLPYRFNLSSSFVKWIDPQVEKVIVASLSVTEHQDALVAKQHLAAILKDSLFKVLHLSHSMTVIYNLYVHALHADFPAFMIAYFPDMLSKIFQNTYECRDFLDPYIKNGADITPFIKDIVKTNDFYIYNQSLQYLISQGNDGEHAWELMSAIYKNFKYRLIEEEALTGTFEKLSKIHEAPSQKIYKAFIVYKNKELAEQERLQNLRSNKNLGKHGRNHIYEDRIAKFGILMDTFINNVKKEKIIDSLEKIIDDIAHQIAMRTTTPNTYNTLIKDLGNYEHTDDNNIKIKKLFHEIKKDAINKNFIEPLIHKHFKDDRKERFLKLFESA